MMSPRIALFVLCLVAPLVWLLSCHPSLRQDVRTIASMPSFEHLSVASTDETGSIKSRWLGRASFTGPIADALERARWAARELAPRGWKLDSLTGTPQEATAKLHNTMRQAELHIIAGAHHGTLSFVVNATLNDEAIENQ